MAKKTKVDEVMAKEDNFLRELIAEIKDENASIAADALSSAEFGGYISTGSYAFNALLSGSIYGGFPDNKALCLAGKQAVGKTFIALSLVKQFLLDCPKGMVVWYLTEPAITKKMIVERGIDPERILLVETDTCEKLNIHALKVLDLYKLKNEETRKEQRMMLVVDSLGALSTEKEMADLRKLGNENIDNIDNKKVTKDMTRAQKVKTIYRTLALQFARVQVPFVVTNHVYANTGGYGEAEKMGGGSGALYHSDMIAWMTKKKATEGSDKNKIEVGVLIEVEMEKNRFARTNLKGTLLLRFDTGLDKYYGLLPIAVEAGIFKELSQGRYEMPDGSKPFGVVIEREPEKYFTKEILDKIDEYTRTHWEYGKAYAVETIGDAV